MLWVLQASWVVLSLYTVFSMGSDRKVLFGDSVVRHNINVEWTKKSCEVFTLNRKPDKS